jgi:hypothetical protein
MIYRRQFRSILKNECVETFENALDQCKEIFTRHAKESGINFLRIYRYENNVFIYAESLNSLPAFDWPEQMSEYFENWPTDIGLKHTKTMLDIFHDADPRLTEGWLSREKPFTSVGSLIFLKPEMYSSYIFYHFQLQEEGLRKFNKSFVIGSEGVCLFAYHEEPAVVDPLYPPGILSTNNSPLNWEDLMDEHFQRWPESPTERTAWRKMKLILSL